jgi:UDP-3-O-acyl-N-acetylglucosamine deacetylase
MHGVRPGHAINNKLLRKLLADESAWESVEMDVVVDEIADFEARGELVRA